MNDRRTVNLVIGLLGAVALLSIAGLIVLLYHGATAAEILPVSSIATTAVGALGGVLASTGSVDLDGLAKLADDPAKK